MKSLSGGREIGRRRAAIDRGFGQISDKDMGIATGYAPTVNDAIEAVDRTYADWLGSKPAG
jgi:hypothetical protein